MFDDLNSRYHRPRTHRGIENPRRGKQNGKEESLEKSEKLHFLIYFIKQSEIFSDNCIRLL